MLEILRKYVRPVIVLKTEGKALAAAGLNAKLPTNAFADDSTARYRACGIEVEPYPTFTRVAASGRSSPNAR